jgi:hypothetical protein
MWFLYNGGSLESGSWETVVGRVDHPPRGRAEELRRAENRGVSPRGTTETRARVWVKPAGEFGGVALEEQTSAYPPYPTLAEVAG